MMPSLSRFHIVIWLLVMCPSRGVKWQSFRWCSRPGGVGQDHVRQKLLTQRSANVWISQLNL